jgi:hypothetical protein
MSKVTSVFSMLSPFHLTLELKASISLCKKSDMTHFLFDDCFNSVSAGSLRNHLPQAHSVETGPIKFNLFRHFQDFVSIELETH